MYDVAIIGAGVTGSAIARELSRYQLNVCVIEREEDVCCGTSKANSAIIHAGFDAVPGTLKAKVNVKGNAMMDQIAKELDIPIILSGGKVFEDTGREADIESVIFEGMGVNSQALILENQSRNTVENVQNSKVIME